VFHGLIATARILRDAGFLGAGNHRRTNNINDTTINDTMKKNYLELATRDAGDFEHSDLLLLIANLYERLDKLNALETEQSN
tara:strand:+ start:457 stop:702 length:246 start_codon:yes stop_codon:yes gene_type:complete